MSTAKSPGYYKQRARWAKDPEKRRLIMQRSRRRRAGIPEPEYPCPSSCEICERLFTVKNPGRIDHDHVTGRFRGWVCNVCNVGLGMFGDSVDRLRAAIHYLQEHARGN